MIALSRRYFFARLGRKSLERLPGLASMLGAKDETHANSGPIWMPLGRLSLFPPRDEPFLPPSGLLCEGEPVHVISRAYGIGAGNLRGDRYPVRMTETGILETCLSERWPSGTLLCPMTGERILDALFESPNPTRTTTHEDQNP